MAIEIFMEQIKNMAQEIENSIQSQKTKVAENLLATYLENSLVFQLDDEPILSVNISAGFTTSFTILIP